MPLNLEHRRLLLLTFMVAKASDYEPLLTFPDNQPQFVDLTVNDSLRDRDIPLRVYFLRIRKQRQ